MRQATTLLYPFIFGLLFLFGQQLLAQNTNMISPLNVPVIGFVPIFEISEHQAALDGIDDGPFNEDNVIELNGSQFPFIGQIDNINVNAYVQGQVADPILPTSISSSVNNDQTDKNNSVTEQSSILQVQAAPNPASQFLKITSPEPITADLAIYNILGQKVHSATLMYSQSTLLNVSHLASGNYILQARDDAGEVVTQRIQIHQ